MQRYFIPESSLETGSLVELEDTDHHHLFKVMRAKAGDMVEIVDSAGHLYLAQVEESNKTKQADLIILESLDTPISELPVNVCLAVGISKNDRLDWLVQKATELGATTIIPLKLERNVVQWPVNKLAQKLERLQKIANNAAQQAKRLKIPRILAPMTLAELIQSSADYDVKWLAYEETAKSGQHGGLVHDLNQLSPKQEVLAVFGPEGGIDPVEANQLIEAQFKTISLGPRILRAETAPAYLMSLISYQMELIERNEEKA
ncbi:RsmE family RNA methyltransferase [Ignavigranum ruoffiae]|uniref:RsmE family RNA methyltransferase n=1 Tax=Ignavigranum ruoffiae TaxID=89093 RepID=UPI003B00134F